MKSVWWTMRPVRTSPRSRCHRSSWTASASKLPCPAACSRRSSREAITKLLHTTGFDRIVPVKDDYKGAVAALDEDPDA